MSFNIALGKIAEYAARVLANDPANSALIVVAIDANGDTDDTMKNRDDLAALLGGTANEVTNVNYARKTITDALLGPITVTVTDASDKVEVDFPDLVWTGIAAGTAWTDLIICYDSDTTAGTDANIVPLTCHDFAMTPDGSNITATLNASGFFRAT